jgi:hypothetical protein
MASTCVEGKVLLRVSRLFSLFYAVFMGFLTVFLLAMGLSLGHVYMSMGCLVGSAVGPCSFSILIERTNARSVPIAAVFGLFFAILGWIITAQIEFGEVKYETVMSDWPWVVGNLCALFGGFGVVGIATLIRPDKEFRWSMINDQIPLVDDALPRRDPVHDTDELLLREVLIAKVISISLTVIFIILWPIPQHVWGGIMGANDFTFWVVLAIVMALLAGIFIIVFPLFEVYTDIFENRNKGLETRHISFLTDEQLKDQDQRLETDASQKKEMYDRMAKRKDEMGTKK